VTCFSLFNKLISAFPGQSERVEDLMETRSRFAMLEDVRLVANGLLQLGHSLREFVHKTKSQITDIFQKISIFDTSFYQLSTITSEIKEEEEELMKTTGILKASNEKVINLSQEIHAKMNNILENRSQLQQKVVELEEKISVLIHDPLPADQMDEISALKDVIDAQEKSISDLLKAVREQHEQLSQQKIKIKIMEEKVPYQPDLNGKGTKDLCTALHHYHPSDCQDVFDKGERNSGVYLVKPNQSEPFSVYCDMTAGSTVIQRRQDGSVEFDQTWEKYENGFGSLEREFWLGLRKIHSIARQGDYILRIELEDWKQGRRSADYHFSLEGAALHYAIRLRPLSGSLEDALGNQTGMGFTTKDRDNDNDAEANCAHSYTGGWWFNACGDANLNGKYIHGRARGRTERRRGMHWKPSRGSSYSIRTTKISIHPVPQDRRPSH
uniref:Angiopoietin like 3 n=1 Tax=Paramormyrops kingsleyae TaxID=1676925 RepID=A0A3B3T617_9TELE